MNNQIKQLLTASRYATVSTVDADGNPWAAPVWYVADDELNIYWWSAIGAQHSQNIAHNSLAYITIFDSNLPEGDGIGLYIQATAAPIPDDELEGAINLYNASTQKFKMSRENCAPLAPSRLYKASPRAVWINDGLERDGYYRDIRKDARTLQD